MDSSNINLDILVEQYRAEGLSFFPIPFKSKKAVIKWESYQEHKPTEDEIKGWFNGHETNIAVICGKVSGNLVVLDCDSQEKFSELSANICRSMGIDDIRDFTRISQTSRGYHIWLRTKEPLKSQKFPDLDIKAEGAYILAPNSIHPSGTQYKFINDRPIVKVDNLKLIGIDLDQRPEETKTNEPGWVTTLLQGVPASGGIRNGRNCAAASLAGYFRNLLPQDVTERILLDWNLKNIPPMGQGEVLEVIASVYKRPEHPPAPPTGYIYNNSLINT